MVNTDFEICDRGRTELTRKKAVAEKSVNCAGER
jgi:hypothetical protein